MYYFLFDVVATPPADDVAGQAVVWVHAPTRSDAEQRARRFTERQGLTVRAVRAAQKPTPEDLEKLPLEELAACAEGLKHGIWGYFVDRGSEEAARGAAHRVRALTQYQAERRIRIAWRERSRALA